METWCHRGAEGREFSAEVGDEGAPESFWGEILARSCFVTDR